MIREIAASVNKLNGVRTANLEQIFTAYSTRNIGRGRRDAKDNKATRYCNHYKRSGHNTDQCFKLVGYPDWYKGAMDTIKGKASVRVDANMVGLQLSDNPLEEASNYKDILYSSQIDTNWVQTLIAQKMMKGKQGTDSQSSSSSHSDGNQSPFAHFAGIHSISSHSNICCSMTKGYCSSWIVDTRASDHMTFEHTPLKQSTKPSKPIFVTLPDGTFKHILQIGQVNLTPSLNL